MFSISLSLALWPFLPGEENITKQSQEQERREGREITPGEREEERLIGLGSGGGGGREGLC